MISTATTFSLVLMFLVGAYEGLSGKSASINELEIELETPSVA
jgi:hypothetical protein